MRDSTQFVSHVASTVIVLRSENRGCAPAGSGANGREQSTMGVAEGGSTRADVTRDKVLDTVSAEKGNNRIDGISKDFMQGADWDKGQYVSYRPWMLSKKEREK